MCISVFMYQEETARRTETGRAMKRISAKPRRVQELAQHWRGLVLHEAAAAVGSKTTVNPQ